MISLVLATVLMAAAADPAQAAAGAPAKAEKASKNELVCKKEPVLGSRMKQRVCLTQAEWDQRKNDSRDQLDEAQRNQPMNN